MRGERAASYAISQGMTEDEEKDKNGREISPDGSSRTRWLPRSMIEEISRLPRDGEGPESQFSSQSNRGHRLYSVGRILM